MCQTNICPLHSQIHMVYSKRSGKPRGYAFIEYEHERDMHCEYLPPEPCPLTLSLLCCPSPFLSSVPTSHPAKPDISNVSSPSVSDISFFFFLYTCFLKTKTKIPHNVCVCV